MSRIITAVALLSTAVSGPALAQGVALTGSVTAPAGQSVAGALAVACPEPFNQCNSQSVTAAVQGSGRQGSYTLRGLNPNRRYQVMVWNDMDRDQNPGPGDLVGMANGGRGVKPGAGSFDIVLKLDGGAGSASSNGGGASVATRGGGSGSVGGITGRWAQSSTRKELVLTPVLRTTPSSATAGRGMVTGSAGGFTTVLRDQEVPLMVERSIELTIQPGGSFTMVTTTRHDKSPTNSCKVTKRIEQRGQARISGNQMTLASSGGTTRSDSCGSASEWGNDPRSDVYTFRLSGSQLVLNRNGADWIFQRR